MFQKHVSDNSKLMNGWMMLMFMKCKCKCGSQTPEVLQPSPLIKISSPDLTSIPLLIELLITVPQIIFSFPYCIAFTTLITPHDLVKLDHPTPSHSLPSVEFIFFPQEGGRLEFIIGLGFAKARLRLILGRWTIVNGECELPKLTTTTNKLT